MRNIPDIDLTGGPSSSTTPKQKPMPKRPAPKAMPGSRGSSRIHRNASWNPHKAKTRPTPPGDAPPWVIPALPEGIIEVLSVNEDYAETKLITRHWRDLVPLDAISIDSFQDDLHNLFSVKLSHSCLFTCTWSVNM